MTVKELKEILRDKDDDMPVVTFRMQDGEGDLLDAEVDVVETSKDEMGGYIMFHSGSGGIPVLRFS